MSIYTKLLTLEKLTTANKLLHINNCILVREREREKKGERERERGREREGEEEEEGEGGGGGNEVIGESGYRFQYLSHAKRRSSIPQSTREM